MSDFKKYLPYLVFCILAFVAVYFYYFHYSTFTSSSAYVAGYVLILSLIFGGYKFVQSQMGVKSYCVTPIMLGVIFFIHLLIASMYYVGLSGNNFFLGTTVWAFISIQLIVIILLWSLIYLVGKRSLSFLKIFSEEDVIISRIIALALGFFLTTLGLFTLASIGQYNLYGLLGLVGVMILGVLPTIKDFFYSLKKPLWTADLKTDQGYIASFINELHYIILTLLISVNFISAYRPYPIGWDDLGAYMNYPKLLSSGGELISMGNMYMWELYTGIGYILGSQSSAFLLNSFSGVIVALVLFLGLTLLRRNESKHFWKQNSESVFSYPLFATVILMILPMTVFQLAKDMKLDYGLLFMSLAAVFGIFYALYRDISLKSNPRFWILMGVCIGAAFTIKVTSLLLLLAIITFIAYRLGGLFFYLAIFFLIISFFSLGGLWSMLNVVFPTEGNTGFYYGLGALVLATLSGIYAFRRDIDISGVVDYSKHIALLLCGFTLAFLPWGVKHFSEIQASDTRVTVGTLISGVSERLRPDYTRIYTSAELSEISQGSHRGLSEEGTTSNEDFGRYFGYESGINNYLKLPWNLTFQSNQGGEFTAISYIFFILLPVFIFVFSYKSSLSVFGILGALLLTLIYFIPSPLSAFLTELLGGLRLPFGYILIMLGYFSLLIYMDRFVQSEKGDYSELYKGILAFGTVYVFFWAISAFGIVWYGIVMYAVFLMLIVIGLHQSHRQGYTFLPYLALMTLWIYIIVGGLAHATSNLKNAGYLDFKVAQVSEYQALMKYHPEYFEFLFAFNLSDTGQTQVIQSTKQQLIQAFSQIAETESLLQSIAQIQTPLELFSLVRQLDETVLPYSIEKKLGNIKEELYASVIAPSEEIKSQKNIYRLGTFMTYFMVDNNTRVWQDNLIYGFDEYLWDEDYSIITQRLQKLDMGYMIFDLNAATIDDDPRKDLTRRYENLLRYALSSELDYITGDSICFRIASDLYQAGDISEDEALAIAGVNYGEVAERQEKMTQCVVTLYESVRQGIYSEREELSYLFPYKRQLENIVKILSADNIEITDQEVLSRLARSVGRGYKILLRIPE